MRFPCATYKGVPLYNLQWDPPVQLRRGSPVQLTKEFPVPTYKGVYLYNLHGDLPVQLTLGFPCTIYKGFFTSYTAGRQRKVRRTKPGAKNHLYNKPMIDARSCDNHRRYECKEASNDIEGSRQQNHSRTAPRRQLAAQGQEAERPRRQRAIREQYAQPS